MKDFLGDKRLTKGNIQNVSQNGKNKSSAMIVCVVLCVENQPKNQSHANKGLKAWFDSRHSPKHVPAVPQFDKQAR